MNFSWVIRSRLAGSQGPVLRHELLYLKVKGIKAVVRLDRHTMSAEEVGLKDLAEYVPDFQPPTADQIDRIITFIHEQIADNSPVAVSCMAGLGRTGTVLSCYLVYTGIRAKDAIKQLRKTRPGSVQSPDQEQFVYGYEQRIRSVKAESGRAV